MRYTVERVRIGILAQQEVDVVRMPRAQFLRLVDDLLVRFPGLREKLRPVAETMPSFPMGEWLNEERGCGCVVGEYLIASSELERAQFVTGENETVPELLARDPQGDLLVKFGEDVDRMIRHEIRSGLGYEKVGWSWLRMPDAVLIEDPA